MDPFLVGAGVAAAVEALRRRGQRRKAAKLVLDTWDEKLKPRRGSPGKRIKIPPSVRAALWVMKGPCRYSAGALDQCDRHEEIDHRVPLAHGGSNYADNLDPICHHHHKPKGAKFGLKKKSRGRKRR